MKDAESSSLDPSRGGSGARERLRGDADAAALSPSKLPAAATSFVGRTAELRELARLVDAADHRLVTVHGASGVGKTRLALELARTMASQGRFRDGVFFVALEDVPIGALFSAIAVRLGTTRAEGELAAAQVEGVIGERAVLLVLDNFEHHAEEAVALADLLRACPNVQLLVTSRHRLDLVEEQLFPLQGLAMPGGGSPAGEEGTDEAVELFVQRARSTRSDFALEAENASAVREICRAVQGLPLAIELTATWVRALPPDEIARELRRGHELLSSPLRNAPERHRSIAAVLDRSWSLLPPEAQRAARRLAVFQGGFTREAAEQVADVALPLLTRLLDDSLLQRGAGRFHSHPLLSQYARERLAEHPEEQRDTELRHCTHYLELLREWVGREGELARLDREIGNILEAVQNAASRGDDETLVEFMWLLAVEGGYYAARGHTPRSLGLLGRAAAAASELTDGMRAHHLFCKLGDAQKFLLGDLDAALVAYREAMDLAERSGNFKRLALMLSAIGQTRFEQGADDADEQLERAYELAYARNEDLALNHVLQHQGILACHRENVDRARELFIEALAVIEAIGERSGIDRAQVEHQLFFNLLNLGEAELRLTNFEEALTLRRRALTMAEERDNTMWQAYALHELGETYHFMNERELAQDHFARALPLWRRHNVQVKAKRLLAFMEVEGYEVPNEG